MKVLNQNLNISGVALSPQYLLDNRLFAATDLGLWVTQDNGKTWQNALISLGSLDPFALTSVIATCGDENQSVVIAGVKGGFLRSEDGGKNWNFIVLPSPPPLVTALTVSANHEIFAGTAQDGIYSSKNHGRNWTRWNFGLMDWHVFSITSEIGPSGGQTVFAGTESGVFYSTNQGRSWRETGFPLESGAVLVLSAFSSLAGGLIVAATEAGSLFRSIDHGMSWERCVDENFEGDIVPLVLSDHAAMAVCNGIIWHSVDAALHWTRWNSSPELREAVLSLVPFQRQGTKTQVLACMADGDIRLLDYQ